MTVLRVPLDWALVFVAVAALSARADERVALTNVAGPGFGASATADSCFSALYTADRAIDGAIGRGAHCWLSADSTALPCALTIELGGSYDLCAVVLHQASWNGSQYHSRDVRIEVRSHGEWVTAGEAVLPDVSEQGTEVRFAECTVADAVRVVILSSYGEPQTCGLAEVEVLAAGVTAWTTPVIHLNGKPAPQPVNGTCGWTLLAEEEGPQVMLSSVPAALGAALGGMQSLSLNLEFVHVPEAATLRVLARRVWGGDAQLVLTDRCHSGKQSLTDVGQLVELPLTVGERIPVCIRLHAGPEPVAIELRGLALSIPGSPPRSVPLAPEGPRSQVVPPPLTPTLSVGMEHLLVEWDWRMQDGIGTPRLPVSYARAGGRVIERGDRLARRLRGASDRVREARLDWRAATRAWAELADSAREGPAGERAWLDLHWARRKLMLADPLVPRGALLFAKRVPGAFSHQLTDYYGRYARPGGGLFLLLEPGRSMVCRELTRGGLPAGSYLHPELSYDAQRVLFAFCEAASPPADPVAGHIGRYYHLYEMPVSGGVPTQLTKGPYDDFAPRYLPDGDLLFISTRRLGWHRCGTPGCENYTLTCARADGSMARPISFHETQEWDPVILHDGRIAYTRWDYVDRHAVFYEQLWWTHADGSNPSSLYGNNTFNPVGIWEPRPIPGSDRIMATAAAHHAMTAGSIILVDPRRGVDGPEPIKRLTPETPFPESEVLVAPSWQAVAPGCETRSTEEQERWPGHCYRSPYPLSEELFLAAFSYEPLVGEPHANSPTMFGIYLVDADGNRELLYRDMAISSLWPTPVDVRPRPPIVRAGVAPTIPNDATGRFLIQDIRTSSVALPDERIAAVRVIQLVPKSTPGANNPMVGLANASPGKQVLGTVPVSEDGSAYFEAPAGVPLSFQALDSRGLAVQTMRSVTYLQPGETLGCVGCHEERTTAPRNVGLRAAEQEPSLLRPAPDGARPLSYPLLVQPVLNRHCVTCHSGEDAPAGIRLTGEPEGHFSVSYNALAPLVSFSAWTGAGDFTTWNSEPLSMPGFFGARGSRLWRLIEAGHYGVTLSAEDVERLVTWMDANALFYGTFDVADQVRQLRGERIEGPAIQ